MLLTFLVPVFVKVFTFFFFCRQFTQFFPPGAASVRFCDHVFRTLDLDGNGSLDFKEYVMAMDLVNAKTPEDGEEGLPMMVWK